ncbi:efflux RND transporter periplasmic adaptor subunit [Exilibacterium tricleocarpae]|uniref:Efflux RND transporter periplasmic adaptor subunit n=1 Tax=Exilibacterium tricleocarpae TaxID=2591008 RepID=A0A545U9X9_9GAMM|nr:efflux RND transporter periplasmic adaptor subunit [Exilibacterium tricleocarpae]TQV86271.1 efflux RND transporter periplasmic adaptor subunit [Exilibacterium tricleocarpae]
MKSVSRVFKTRTAVAAIATLTTLVAGIGAVRYAPEVAAAEQVPAAAALPAVDVVTLESRPLRLWSQFSGHLTAVDQVDVRPRVSGTIHRVLFAEGQVVAAGDPLYIIDPRPFEAAVASAEAALTSAESRTRLAKLEWRRAEGLIAKQLISQSIYDTRLNDYRVAAASIDAARAALQQAQLDLEYAHITAPVAGRISRAEITAGNVVEAGANAPVLTTIIANDRLYAEFDVDEQTYIKVVRAGALAGTGPAAAMPVELTLAGDTSVVYQGQIHAFDNRLDTQSGTIRARAIFENSDGALVPGMYANVRLGSAEKNDTLLVSERAIGTDQDRKFVYTVDAAGRVSYREVTLGRTLGGQRVVLSGLAPGERVIVNGLHRVRPDMQVAPVDISTAAQDGLVATR